MIILNHSDGVVALTVTPRRGNAGPALVLREKYRTDEIAATVCATLAKRLGLRRRGTAWIRANSK